MGAYQDVLGDLHNLFGEAHEVLVTVDEEGTPAGRGRPARRVVRARARVHELRPRRRSSTRSTSSCAASTNRPVKKDEVQRIYKEFEAMFPRYTYLER